MTDPDARPYVWMLCGTFSFSVMAILAEALTRHPNPDTPPLCDWQTVAVFRAGLVAIFAALLAKQAGAKLVWFRPGRLWVRSVAGSCSMVGAFYAFGHLKSEDVVTLSNTFPLWVAVLSWPLYGRYPGTKTFVAILVGVVGVALVEQPQIEAGNWGVLAALASAVFSAVAMLGLHRLRDIDPRSVVVHFSVVATVFCLGAFLSTPRSQPIERVLEVEVIAMLLGIGVSATIGQVFLTLAFGSGAPAKVSVVGLMQIVFVMALSWFIFNHPVNTIAIVGTILVIAPTGWLLLQPKATSEVARAAHATVHQATAVPPSPPEKKRDSKTESGSIRPPLSTPQLRP